MQPHKKNKSSLEYKLSGKTPRQGISQTYHLPLVSTSELAGDIDKFKQDIETAIAENNQEKEATARINLSCVLLAQEDEQAITAFEEALALVRRIGDHRRELILYLNFTLHFLAIGQIARAFQMANRAVELAKYGLIYQKIIAAFNLGRIWQEGYNEPHKAVEYQRQAVLLLKQYFQENPQAAKELMNWLEPYLADAAQNALDLGLQDQAVEIVTLLNPEAAKEIEEIKVREQTRKVLPALSKLKTLTYPHLDPILAAWRASDARVRKGRGQIECKEVLQRMARIADILGWKEAQAHLMQIPTTVQADSNSCGGPGGLIHLAEMIAAGEVELEKAQPLAQQLAVPDNELECISLFAMQDDTLERSGVAFALMRLCVAQIVDPRQIARFYRVLGMIAQEHEAKLQFYLAGDARLANSGYLAERANLRNEAAVALVSLGHYQEAYDMASSAQKLAEKAGDQKRVAMASGNQGLALMHLRRFQEALDVFEKVAKLEESLGDTEGLANTRFNLDQVRMLMGDYSNLT